MRVRDVTHVIFDAGICTPSHPGCRAHALRPSARKLRRRMLQKMRVRDVTHIIFNAGMSMPSRPGCRAHALRPYARKLRRRMLKKMRVRDVTHVIFKAGMSMPSVPDAELMRSARTPGNAQGRRVKTSAGMPLDGPRPLQVPARRSASPPHARKNARPERHAFIFDAGMSKPSCPDAELMRSARAPEIVQGRRVNSGAGMPSEAPCPFQAPASPKICRRMLEKMRVRDVMHGFFDAS